MRIPSHLLQTLFPSIYCRFHEKNNYLYLTYDDGPNPETTEVLLERLQHHGIRATFFVKGLNVKQYPSLLEKIASHCHTIGNHSYSHPSMFFKTRYEILEEIQRTNILIQDIIGYQPQYFRPPYGHISPSLIRSVRDLKMKLVLWSFDTRDFKRTIQTLTKIKLHNIKNGDIILCHDANSTKDLAVLLLDAIVEYSKKHSLKFAQL